MHMSYEMFLFSSLFSQLFQVVKPFLLLSSVRPLKEGVLVVRIMYESTEAVQVSLTATVCDISGTKNPSSDDTTR